MQNKYYAAEVIAVDHNDQKITCKEVSDKTFDVRYDILAIATGSQGRCPSLRPTCKPLSHQVAVRTRSFV